MSDEPGGLRRFFSRTKKDAPAAVAPAAAAPAADAPAAALPADPPPTGAPPVLAEPVHVRPKPTPEASLAEHAAKSTAEVPHPALAKGTNLYGSTKLFPDIQAGQGQSWFSLVHGVAHESSVSFVAILQATRALRKGYETALYFYGPGAMNCIANRGFPTTGNAAFPGETNVNSALETFIAEGGTAFCCRFGLALHGFREEDLIAGVVPAHPLDVQDAVIHYARKGAIIQSNFQV